ncbi:peptide ABC transporter substrate-binding protein [Opitutus sp. GAS368]|uniref:peptide ABC transporter substrate-binding protein n=1 Tax=Opitutus sp. GAS368 TaxID=1882749 RepID=UPI0012FD4B3D|nr:peptide ABC transporter substrate-binding protein [Opitutus sp. GAS368]
MCLFAAIESGCSKQAIAPATGVLRVSQRNEPATLDPQLATLPDEFFVIRALSEGLVTPSPVGGTPLPAVASHWEASADGLTWTFHLSGGSFWSNGDVVTAQDFVWSIKRALTPATAVPKASLFFPIRNAAAFLRGTVTDFAAVGVTAPDPRTLVITLARPTADFLAIAASGPWIPVHPATVEKFGADWARPEHYVGNGRFLLAEWRPHQRIVVRKNPHHLTSHLTQLAGIEFLAFDNGDSEERAFRAGQLDVTMAVPVTKLAGYRTAEPPVLHSVPLFETRYLVLNTTRPPLNDVRVRQALALALDRTALVEKVLLSGQPAFNFVPAGLGGYAPSAQIKEDAAKARSLLAAAGFPGGEGFPRLELSSWPVNPAQLEAIQQMWRRELGIEVALASREARTHLVSLASGDFAIAFMTAIPDYDGASDLFTQLTSGHPLNYPHWRNAEFDHQVATARSLTDPSAYQGAERILLNEMPVIPLYFNAQNFLVAPRVHGWQADRLWTRFYGGLSVE